MRFWSITTIDPLQQKLQSKRFLLGREVFLSDLKVAQKQAELKPGLLITEAANRILYTLSGASISALHSPDLIGDRQLRRLPNDLVNELKR